MTGRRRRRLSVVRKIASTILPLLAASLLLSAAPAAAPPQWTGSKACAACHPAIYAVWSKTPMAQTAGDVATRSDPVPDQSFTDSRSVYKYAVSARPPAYTLTISKAGSPAPVIRTPLRYFIGSGASARSYLIDIDGFLYEAPVSWYSEPKRWAFAPGYDKYSYPFLARAVPPGCLECHATGVRTLPDTQNGYENPPFLEGGVACERCHGPGAVHARTGRREDIVNPARLDPERREGVCDQCHLSGDVRVPRRTGEFRAGERFTDYAISFSRQTAGSRFAVASHAENLAASACKRASGDRLWCGACHDPHAVPAAAGRSAWYRSKCLACHSDASCAEKPAARAARSDNCIACHMPRRQVADAAHVVSTDHSIPRRPFAGPPGRTPPDAPLIPLDGAAATPRDLGLAYAILAAREPNPVYRDRAFDLLRQAEPDHPDDPQVLAYLADLYRQRSDPAQAIRRYEKLLRIDPSQSAAPAALGAYAMERGDYDDAIRLWQRALRVSPALLLVRANLALALTKTGRPEEARAVLRKALEFNPEFPAARKLLDRLR